MTSIERRRIKNISKTKYSTLIERSMASSFNTPYE